MRFPIEGLVVALFVFANTGCDPQGVSCYPLVDDGSRCICPVGTTQVDDWVCALPDGGFLERPGRPDGGLPDSGLDAASDSGPDDRDSGGEDSSPACIPSPGACNGRDDDCDGRVDEDADGQCAATAHGTNACVEGACVLVSCEAGYEQCRSDGLCTWTDESPLDCGACGSACDADQACSSGDCVDSWGTASVTVAGTSEWDLGGEVAAAGSGSYWVHRVGDVAYTSLLDSDGETVWRRPVPVPLHWMQISVHAGRSSFFGLGRSFALERVESDFGVHGAESRSGHKVGIWSRTLTGDPRWLHFFESTISVQASAPAFNSDDEGCFSLNFRGRVTFRGETLVDSSLDQDSAVVCVDTESGDVISVFTLSGPGADSSEVLGLIGDDVLLRVTTAGDLPWGDRTLTASSLIARVARDGSPVWQVPFVDSSSRYNLRLGAFGEEIIALAFHVDGTLTMHGVSFRYDTAGSNGMTALLALEPRTGGLLWTSSSSNSGSTRPVGLHVAERGVYVLAGFNEAGGFGSSTPPVGSGDILLARFAHAGGALAWARVLGSEGIDYPRDMSCDAAGRCRISFDFDGSPTYFGEEYVAENYYDSGVLLVEVE